jgi:hypothetical protein
MQDVLTYKAWLNSVCHICNSLLKANVSIVDNEFKVVASKYRWITFINLERIHYVYDKEWESAWGATELMRMIIDEWEQLLIDEDDK